MGARRRRNRRGQFHDRARPPTPWQLHAWPPQTRAEETYFVLEGKAAFWTDTDDEVIVEKHEDAFFPPDEKHAYRNAGTDDLLILFALAGPRRR